MTTKRTPKAQKQPARPSPVQFIGFVNIQMTDSAKEDVLEEQEDAQALERHLDSLLSHGFKVTFSYNVGEASYQATATGTENAGTSAGYATSARSEDITRALLALSAKVIVIAELDLSSYASTTKREFDA